MTLSRRYSGTDSSGSYQDTTTTYEGYGRVASQQMPAQSPGTATTWAYNDDDTVRSVTDARGATTTYAYNGRHLPTSITYSASGGISVPAPVTYAYDAAGNRMWMEENGQRRMTYHYNSLSMMDWEERQFPGLTGTYRLSYDYNLAGQLKSIADPTNSTISYAHDRAGRVTGISGTPYGTGGVNGVPYIEISQYASNLKYRAWGALKSLTYGNQMTLEHQFNQRLQLTQYLVGNQTLPSGAPPTSETRLMSSNFQYYADGNLRFASDNLGNVFDRAYAYDQVGGASEAYSGSEALDFLNGTNSGTATGPYRQSFQHDAFGNMTSHTSRFWSQSALTTNLSYTNNRRQDAGITYDANGNLTQDADLQYTYDAAGRNASIFNAATSKTITPVYDGDSQVVHRTEVEGTTTIANFFQLRSTVLGGKVITELDSAGQKKMGYIYCNGKLIARQEPNWVTWQHDNPFTGTRGISNRDGHGGVEVEPDALGVDMGLFDPFPVPEQWEPPADGLVGLFPGSDSGGSGMPSGRCTLDGIAIFCRDAANLLHMGAAEFEHPTAIWDDGWVFVTFNRQTEVHEGRSSIIIPNIENDRLVDIVTTTRRVESDTEELFRLFAFKSARTVEPLHETPATSPQEPIEETFHRLLVTKAFLKKLGHCLRDLFNVIPFETGFVNKADGSGGSLTFKVLKTNAVLTVRSDTTLNSEELASMQGKPELMAGSVYGLATPTNPFTNFIAKERANVKGNPNQSDYMLYLAIQVHETGNSLAFILGDPLNRKVMPNRPVAVDPKLRANDSDSGMALEECVFGAVDTRLRHSIMY